MKTYRIPKLTPCLIGRGSEEATRPYVTSRQLELQSTGASADGAYVHFKYYGENDVFTIRVQERRLIEVRADREQHRQRRGSKNGKGASRRAKIKANKNRRT